LHLEARDPQSKEGGFKRALLPDFVERVQTKGIPKKVGNWNSRAHILEIFCWEAFQSKVNPNPDLIPELSKVDFL